MVNEAPAETRASGFRLARQFRAEAVALQRPNLIARVVIGDLAPNARIKIFGAGARAFANNLKTILQGQCAHGQSGVGEDVILSGRNRAVNRLGGDPGRCFARSLDHAFDFSFVFHFISRLSVLRGNPRRNNTKGNKERNPFVLLGDWRNDG